ncbi:protein-disulfide reductase DsbD domain-containing protein [Microvirga flavescens]|uniref:protein-disulfide reductase DsbD domain-containing protein n=1 Tax=Microvirga flavescens TaxID=2249811 RepID=UPI000DDAFFB2|nr:protein-disulfide reductase DsbD domain-containing protein [Microvirga flavescens]
MSFVRHAAITTLLLLFCSSPAWAESASPWTQGFHSRVRLLSGGREGERLLAGVEVELDDGFKTYWRTPGDSGLPPRFDWNGSRNVSDIDIRWPAPSRLEDAGGVTYVYSHRVVLPILLRAADPAKPSHLSLSIEYGVCKDICIPAHAELNLDLAGDGERAAIAAALAGLPKSQPLGAPGDLSILAVTPHKGDRPAFLVETRAPANTQPQLFAEGPENWYLSTAKADASGAFLVTVEESPKGAPTVQPFLFTLTANGRAIETELRLDAGERPR